MECDLLLPDQAMKLRAFARTLDEEAAQVLAAREGKSHRFGQPTEHKAAQRRLPGWGTQCGLLLRSIVERGHDGYTQNEMERIPGIRTNAHRTRKNDLEDMGLVMDSGRTRKTETGTDAIVWIATLKGHRWHEENVRRRAG
jgi:hypothetical protein